MLSPSFQVPAIAAISVLTAIALVVRPFRWPEAVWAVLAAFVLLVTGLLSVSDAFSGIAKGLDVYLFLTGMMLISEMARKEGLFDWMAAIAVSHAKGSPRRLFVLIYLVGILVTVFMSNDATAVVLTPAVYAACKAARVRDPLPYLLICAFVANAASFVLPISNPANLVVFGGGHMPALGSWLSVFAVPSVISIIVTFAALYLTQKRALATDNLESMVERVTLSRTAGIAGIGLAATAFVLLIASWRNVDLGLPTFLAGSVTLMLVSLFNRENPLPMLREISWSVIPLVAGLFVVVEALGQTGMIEAIAAQIDAHAASAPALTVMGGGLLTGIITNLVNNLPAGLVAGGVVQSLHGTGAMPAALLVGIDLGPNLSITGSLATILWLTALRRERVEIGFWQFLKIGAVTMLPALVLTLAAVGLMR
jgi:arsenical pump membrane protein